jgi:hypothetical protein
MVPTHGARTTRLVTESSTDDASNSLYRADVVPFDHARLTRRLEELLSSLNVLTRSEAT